MQQNQHLFDVLLGNRDLQPSYYPRPAVCEEHGWHTVCIWGTLSLHTEPVLNTWLTRWT